MMRDNIKHNTTQKNDAIFDAVLEHRTNCIISENRIQVRTLLKLTNLLTYFNNPSVPWRLS
jgi:hypothetical protein